MAAKDANVGDLITGDQTHIYPNAHRNRSCATKDTAQTRSRTVEPKAYY